MKKLAYLILFSSILSCNTDSCVDYLIFNNTNEDFNIIQFGNFLEPIPRKFESMKNTSVLSICDAGKNSLTYNGFDSVQVIVDDVVKKTYYPTDAGKSIYKTEDVTSWKLVENRDHYQKFVFEISENDFD